MTRFIRLSFSRIPFDSSTPSICPSDVTFTVAGGDGDGRGGCLAGQTGLRTGRVPQAVHGAVLVRQGANRAAGQDLLLEPGQETRRDGTAWHKHVCCAGPDILSSTITIRPLFCLFFVCFFFYNFEKLRRKLSIRTEGHFIWLLKNKQKKNLQR